MRIQLVTNRLSGDHFIKPLHFNEVYCKLFDWDVAGHDNNLLAYIAAMVAKDNTSTIELVVDTTEAIITCELNRIGGLIT